MKTALVLRESEIQSALTRVSQTPWLALGFESSAQSSLAGTEPAWLPQNGDSIPSKDGSYTVLASRKLLPGFPWPWLLCAKRSERAPQEAQPSFQPSDSSLGLFARLCFVSSAALCLRDGQSRSTVNEKGQPLRLVSPATLAKAFGIASGDSLPGLSSRLGFMRSARPRSPLAVAPEISAELAKLLRF